MSNRLKLLCSAATLLALSATTGTAVPDANAVGMIQQLSDYVRPESIPYPPDNAYSEERVELGKTLFFDPRLSASGITSCASCHNPGFDWGDQLPVGVGAGMKPLGRRTPTILNTAWAELLFWDGRAETLEEQALGPIESPAEMGMDLDDMVRTVEGIAGYQPMFQAAYPGEPIGKETVAKAIATFERTIVSSEAPFDRWVEGDQAAVSESAKLGFEIFNGKAKCASCHSGWRFTDDSFHDIGTMTSDKGRGALFEEVEPLQHAFKTPTLRNVDRRAPYMHNGSEKTLEEVVDLYDIGGRVKRSSLSSEIVPLDLDPEEKLNLLAFLATLTSDSPLVSIPRLPR